MTITVKPITAETLEHLAAVAGVVIPIEQSRVWDGYDRALTRALPDSPRQGWGRAVILDDSVPVAVIALTRYTLRGQDYLWARHGPVWLRQPDEDYRRQALEALAAWVRARSPRIAFIRLHAPAADYLHPLLQTMTYDRTVVVDLSGGEDVAFASLASNGRRCVRKARKNDDLLVADATAAARADFSPYYEVFEATAKRDSFAIFPASVYRAMLDGMPDNARLYEARVGGELAAWAIVTEYAGAATYYYGASNSLAHRSYAADGLHWHIITDLIGRGALSYDLMGTASALAPSLAGVTQFKKKWNKAGPIEVEPAWELPVSRPRFAALVAGRRAKDAFTVARGYLRERFSRTRTPI